MAYHQTLGFQQTAIVGSIGIGVCKGYETSAQYLQAANRILDSGDHPTLTEQEFLENIKLLKKGGMVGTDGQNYTLMGSNQIKLRRSNTPNGLVEQSSLPAMHMKHKLLLKNGIDYSIIFNCDGKGSTQLPDGTIEYITLNALSVRLVDKHQLIDREGKGGYIKWVMDPIKHSMVTNTKTIMSDFMNEHYPIPN